MNKNKNHWVLVEIELDWRSTQVWPTNQTHSWTVLIPNGASGKNLTLKKKKKKSVSLHFLTCGLKNPPPASFGAVSASVNILDWKLEGAGRSFQSDVYSSRLLLSAARDSSSLFLQISLVDKNSGLPSRPCLDNSAPVLLQSKKKKKIPKQS